MSISKYVLILQKNIQYIKKNLDPCSGNPCGQGICEIVRSLPHGYLCRCPGEQISLTSCNRKCSRIIYLNFFFSNDYLFSNSNELLCKSMRKWFMYRRGINIFL